MGSNCTQKVIVGIFIAIVAVSVSAQMYGRGIPIWERLGLSVTEWKLIKENNMSMEKVENLLKAGIGVSEYYKYPWEYLGTTEEQWIIYRSAGLTDNMIYRKMHPEKAVIVPDSNNVNLEQKPDISGKVQGFFLPGYLQCKSGRNVLGITQISIAAVGIAGATAWTIKKHGNPSPIAFITMTTIIPDMVWSYATRTK